MTRKSNDPLENVRAKKTAESIHSSSYEFTVKLWGARGSLPTPVSPSDQKKRIRDLLTAFLAYGKSAAPKIDQLDHFLSKMPLHIFGGYGGNTSCVEVCSPKQQLIIDGGSGLRPLGYQMMNGPAAKGRAEIHILFTHFHWDHLIGLPFFTPIFIPGNKIHVYSVQPELESVFKILFQKPYFPVSLNDLGADIRFHQLEPRKPKVFGDLTVTPYQLDHPDPCWGFRIEKNGKVYAHCVDTECARVSREDLGPDLPLYQGVDTMLFDAQYTLMESIEKVNWGHAAASLGIDLAMRERIRRVVFVHHDPASSDEKIAAAEMQARAYYENQLKRAKAIEPHLFPVEWSFGHEGMVLEV